MSPIEIAANAWATLSILLAARNSLHTWWTGIVGCALFVVVFYQSQLYADATLQIFFIVTSMIGWWQWRIPKELLAVDHLGANLVRHRPITRATSASLTKMAAAALIVTVVYGSLLFRFTDAYMPFVDSAVLAVSVVAQFLLMQRKLQTWPAWLLVNSLSVPLFASRGLTITASLYGIYWFNAWYGWWQWRNEQRQQ